MIHARPNLNGNTPEDFREIARELYDAAEALAPIAGKLSADVMHGRNYQTVEDGAARRDEDLARLGEVVEAVRAMRTLALDIQSAATAFEVET